MKYLDENIDLNVSGFTIAVSETYTYRIKEYSTNEYIFYGNTYLTSGTTSCEICCTEIIANRKWNGEVSKIPFSSQQGNRNVNLVNKYRIELLVGNTWYNGNAEIVALLYRYPNKKSYLETELFDYEDSVHSYSRFMMQGEKSTQSTKCLPHIPYNTSTEYYFPIITESTTAFNTSTYKLTGRLSYNPNTKSCVLTAPVTCNKYTMFDLFYDSILTTTSTVEHVDTDMALDSYEGWTQIGTLHFGSEYHGEFTYKMQIKIGSTVLHESDEFTGSVSFTQSVNTHLTGNTSYAGQTIDIALLYKEPQGTQYHISDQHVYFKVGQMAINGKDVHVKYTIRHNSAATTEPPLQVLLFSFKTQEPIQSDSTVYFAGDNVAIVDIDCISKYYLLWQDRLGSFQSQPFNKTETYSEQMERTNYGTYRNEKRIASVKVKPKWQINSGWIDAEKYPFYESIYVSPFVLLYDAKEDKTYRVTVEDTDYTEKTIKNQSRKLFNMNLTLQLDKDQNIQY